MNAALIDRRWIFILIGFVCIGCTDRRRKFLPQEFSTPQAAPITRVAQVQFDGSPTQVLQMSLVDNSLYLTGRPFGFSRWDVGSDPENPRLIFAASDDIERFSPYPEFGFWTPDSFAQGALDVIGKRAFMSGAAGLSIVDTSQTHSPVEMARFPSQKVEGVQVTRDPDFVYSAVTHHPTLPIAYGFAEQDFVYTLSVEATGVRIMEKAAYSNASVCCAMGAAMMGARTLVAMRGSLWVFELLSDGRLGEPTEFQSLQAINVVATPGFIYVQHEPTYGQASGVAHPKGIYVFDADGNPSAFLPVSPIRFAVYQDRYIYANEDNSQISIYRIR